MNISDLAKRAGNLAVRNSPAILAGIGVAGTLVTAYLAGQASFKAARIIDEEQRRLDAEKESHPLDTREKINLVWKLYVPPAGTVILTVGAIVFAHRVGTRRLTVLAAAYEISHRALEEYREKVVETIGPKKERGIQESLSQDRADRGIPMATQVLVLGNGDVLCYESLTGRTFKSNYEDLRRAVNQMNLKINHHGYASLTDFYYAVGLQPTSLSDDMGWRDGHMDISLDPILLPDGKTPGIAVNYTDMPKVDTFCLGA